MPKKIIQLKPGQVLHPLEMQLGVVYKGANPLRETKWAVKSSCCGARVQEGTIDDAVVIEGDEFEQVKTNCQQCHQRCEKVWYQKSRLIPCLSRTDDRAFHLMDQY